MTASTADLRLRLEAVRSKLPMVRELRGADSPRVRRLVSLLMAAEVVLDTADRLALVAAAPQGVH